MSDWFWRWLCRKVAKQALRGRFWPTISAWGNTGVYVWHTPGEDFMEFQYDEQDGEVLWKIMGRTVARGTHG